MCQIRTLVISVNVFGWNYRVSAIPMLGWLYKCSVCRHEFAMDWASLGYIGRQRKERIAIPWLHKNNDLLVFYSVFLSISEIIGDNH